MTGCGRDALGCVATWLAVRAVLLTGANVAAHDTAHALPGESAISVDLLSLPKTGSNEELHWISRVKVEVRKPSHEKRHRGPSANRAKLPSRTNADACDILNLQFRSAGP